MDGRCRQRGLLVFAVGVLLITGVLAIVASQNSWRRLAAALAEASIGCRAYYRTPVHAQPAMRSWGEGLTLPGTEQAARTHLAIPISPVLSREQAEQVVGAIRAAVQRTPEA